MREAPQVPEVVTGQPATDSDNENVNGDGEVTPGGSTVLFNAVFRS